MPTVTRSHRFRRPSSAALALCLAWLVSGCGGGGYGGSSGSNSNPVPTIAGLSPASATAGAASQTLTINGSGFMSGSTVTYNGAAHAATYVGATQLTVQLSAADQASAGSYAVVVTNPAPGGGASNSVNFTVAAANPGNPVPTISSLSPASATVGAAAQTLTIGGAGFIATSTVSYNGVPHAAMFVTANQLTIQLTAGDLGVAAFYPVIVTNPPPGGGASGSVAFAVGTPVPVVSGLTPAAASAGAAAQTLTISGSGFMASSAVTYAGAAQAATYVSASQLSISLSAADQAMVGSYAVVVTNPSPGGGSSNTATFTVTPVIPPGAAAVLILGGQSTASPAAPLKSAEVFASGAFSGAGGMLLARYRPTATLVAGGTAVLIAGGADASGAALNTAEAYQVATKAFGSATTAMQCAHKGHTATVLASGKVLIAGRDGTSTTACAELYDPATGAFTRTGNMTIALSDHAAALLPSGKVLIVGGSIDLPGCPNCGATNSAELYDPTTGTFTATAHPLARARSSPTATLLPSGKVLIAGGGGTPSGGPLNSAELYDPATDSFANANFMTADRQFHSATLLPDGQVLIAGGLSTGRVAVMTAELYDPTAGIFRATGAMTSARLYHTATPVGGGLVLVAGGTIQLGSGVGDSAAELYDSSAGVFTLTGSLAQGRYGAAASPLQ